jgi:hypothetical protein
MAILDHTQGSVTDYENNLTATSINPQNTDGITAGKETIYSNSLWAQHWGYFNSCPELKSAILMKAIWNVGKGYTTDPETQIILDHISGWGKDTFEDILFNMDVIRKVGRDSIAQIIRDKETGTLINLKPLDPASIRWVVDEKGIIIRYEQFAKTGDTTEVKRTFKPDEIFHLSNNRLADQIHGISVIESLDSTLLAELESFTDTTKLMHRQAKPFIVFKLKTDDPVKISAFQTKIQNIRDKTEDLIIPDDENILSYEVVSVPVSSVILDWRNDVTKRFYRALGMPLVIFGSANSTESGGKMEYFAHEQVFEHEQRYLEKQIYNQLGLRINLYPPTSMAPQLAQDTAKDGGAQQLNTQPSDAIAGRGK